MSRKDLSNQVFTNCTNEPLAFLFFSLSLVFTIILRFRQTTLVSLENEYNIVDVWQDNNLWITSPYVVFL